jgi:hypothetical protein
VTAPLRALPAGWGFVPHVPQAPRVPAQERTVAARTRVLDDPALCAGIQPGDLVERYGLTYATALRLVHEARRSVGLRVSYPNVVCLSRRRGA